MYTGWPTPIGLFPFLVALVPIFVAYFPKKFEVGQFFHIFFDIGQGFFSAFSGFVHPISPVFLEIGRLPLKILSSDN